MPKHTKESAMHTPTPWDVVAYYNEDTKSHDFDISADGGGGDMVADLKGLDNAEANATIIVRAVNSHEKLVAALEFAKKELDGMGLGHDIVDDALTTAKEGE